MKNLIALVFLFISYCVNAQSINYDYGKVDKFASSIPSDKSKTIEDLARTISLNTKNDLEKVRAIYVWIGLNVFYDLNSFRKGLVTDQSPQVIFKTKLAVCQGYSELFKKIASLNNIPCEVIAGYSKGYGYRIGKKFKATDHAWVSVKIDGSWYLIDPTWGAGYIDENETYVSKFNDEFYLANPEKFIFRHLPSDPMWQLLVSEVSISTFEKDSNFIKKNIALKEKKYNYADTISKWENLDSTQKIINSSLRIIRYNPENSDALYKLGWFYYTQAWKKMLQLNNKEIQKSKNLAIPLAKEAVYNLNSALKYMNEINPKDSFYGEEVKQKKVVIGQDLKSLQNLINN